MIIRYFNQLCFGVLIALFIACTAKKEAVRAPETVSSAGGAFLWVIKPTVNMREKNSVNSNRLSTLNDGDSVFVLKNSDGWYNVRTQENQTGWVRSDLLGPRGLSVFPKAMQFAENLKKNGQTELFFDSKLHHRKIYISFPSDLYNSRERLGEQVQNLLAGFQEQVYPGALTAHVLKPDSKDILFSVEQSGTSNADVILPISPYGRIVDADFSDSRAARLTYRIQEEIDKQSIISATREMIGVYPISYREILVTYVNRRDECFFWFKEDKSGENYGFDSCP